MFRWAGLGLAMRNAASPVQRMANAVVPSVEDAGAIEAKDCEALDLEGSSFAGDGRSGETQTAEPSFAQPTVME